jgi:ribosomal protein L6P/L9E
MFKQYLIVNAMENNVKILKRSNNILVMVFSGSRVVTIFLNELSQIRYDASTKNVLINGLGANIILKFLEKMLNNLVFAFNRLWHVKIKFAGKGFKIKRRRKTKSIKFFFYYSHINVVVLKKSKIKQRKKNKFIIKSWRPYNTILASKLITSIKNLNVYTKRGIRVSKQLVFKKTGKKSNY